MFWHTADHDALLPHRLLLFLPGAEKLTVDKDFLWPSDSFKPTMSLFYRIRHSCHDGQQNSFGRNFKQSPARMKGLSKLLTSYHTRTFKPFSNVSVSIVEDFFFSLLSKHLSLSWWWIPQKQKKNAHPTPPPPAKIAVMLWMTKYSGTMKPSQTLCPPDASLCLLHFILNLRITICPQPGVTSETSPPTSCWPAR